MRKGLWQRLTRSKFGGREKNVGCCRAHGWPLAGGYRQSKPERIGLRNDAVLGDEDVGPVVRNAGQVVLRAWHQCLNAVQILTSLAVGVVVRRDQHSRAR